jgi:hypothetical protein
MKLKTKYLLNIILLLVILAACNKTTPTGTPDLSGTTDQPGSTDIPPTSFPIPVGTITPDPSMDPNCNLQWSRLRVGDTAYLTAGDRPSRVRSEPLKDPGNVIGQIFSGIVVMVVDGPVCADGMMFWKVEHDSIPGGSGWVAEGDGDHKHWLDPNNCATGFTTLYRYHYAVVRPGVAGLRVYDQSGSDGTVIADISAGVVVKIVDGPYCTDNTSDRLIYWKVESNAIPGGSGWVSEKDMEDELWVRYLEYLPVDPLAFPQPPSLSTILYTPQSGASLELADLENSGQIAYIQDDWAWVSDADGSDAFELQNPLGSYATPSYLSWSADAKSVAMVIGKRFFLLSTVEIDNDLQAFEPVTDPQYYSDISWSFDNQYIAFTANYSIYVMKSDGSDLHEISLNHDDCQSPTWSPYGTYIAYICWEYGASLYLSRADAPGTQTFEAMGDTVAWSPDGMYLAYNDPEDGLSIVEAATGAHAQTLVPEGSDFFAWSPDSKSIAFTYQDQIYLVTIADSSIHNISGHTATEPFDFASGSLGWSPDGKYILFEFQTFSFSKNVWTVDPIYILDVATGARVQVVEKGTLPVWSPVIEYPIVQNPDCTNGWSHLRAGETARLMGAPTDPPNRVRSEGSQSADQVGVLYPGTVVDLIEGPVCADGLVYWKVRGTIYPADPNSTTVPPDLGWTAEGSWSATNESPEYWLEPILP